MTEANKALLRSFSRSLRHENRSARTISSYLETAEQLAAFHPGINFEDMTRDHVDAYLGEYLATHKPAGAAVRFRSLRRLFKLDGGGGSDRGFTDAEAAPTIGP